MIYVFVLFGSLFIICAVLGVRVALRHRSVRSFVRGITKRSDAAQQRGAVVMEETLIQRRRKTPRTSAIEMQQVRTLLRKGELAIAQGKMMDAEKVLIQALTINPDAHDVRAELAKLYLTTEREPKAEAMYRELLTKCDDATFHANLGLACYRQGKFMDAYDAYAAALERDPKNGERFAALGRACIATKRYKEAAENLEKATDRRARDTELLHLLAECYVQLGQLEEAHTVYSRINRLEPYNDTVKKKMQELAAAVA